MTLMCCKGSKSLLLSCLLISCNLLAGPSVVISSLFPKYNIRGLVKLILGSSCKLFMYTPSDGNSNGGVGLTSGGIVEQIITPEKN